MKLITTRFGELEIDDTKVIKFDQGIPGFEEMLHFTLVEVEEHLPFSHLQSVDDGDLAFIVVDPFEFFPEYEFELPEQIKDELQVESGEQIAIRTIVTIRGRLDSAMTNLVAPIVMNMDSRTGKQVILTKTSYVTRHRLFISEHSE